MAVEVHRLELVAASRGLDRLIIDLNITENRVNRTERSMTSLTGAMRGMIAPLAGLVGGFAGLDKLVEVNREFGILTAGLETATGSALEAQQAFGALRDFAQETPYSLKQAVEGFTKLVNLGLTPSERALKSYGDTSAAMGKDLSQMIEAVADAATGEFERLKEFGIKAKNQGDTIAFTFKGITTTVENNASAIEEFLIQMGETNFVGSMEKRMQTLDGAISNLSDTFDNFFYQVGQAGATDALTTGITSATSAIAELNAMLASGELQGYIEAIGISFGSWGDDAALAVHTIDDIIQNAFDYWMTDGKKTTDFIANAFKEMPQNIHAFIQLAINDIIYMADVAGSYGRNIANALNPFSPDYDLDASLQRSADAYNAGIEGIVLQLEKTNKDAQERVDKAKNDRALSDLLDQWIKDTADADRLAKYKAGGASVNTKSESDAAKKKRESEFVSLKNYLMTEEEAIQSSYDKRLAIIKANTKKGSDYQSELIAKLKAKREEEIYGLNSSKVMDDAVNDFYKRQEAARERLKTLEGGRFGSDLAAYQQRLADIDITGGGQDQRKKASEAYLRTVDQQLGLGRSDDVFAQQLAGENDRYSQEQESLRLALEGKEGIENEYRQRAEELERKHNENLNNIDKARNQYALQTAGGIASTLSGIAKNTIGEQSRTYKTLFGMSQAFAIADSTVQIADAIAKAANTPFPANLGAIATVASATAGIVSSIQAVKMLDTGGYVPAGAAAIVGEMGPEIVNGPAYVESRRNSAEKLQANKSGPSGVVVNIINQADVAVTKQRETVQSDGTVMVDLVIKRLASDIQQGGNQLSRSMEATYGLRRGA